MIDANSAAALATQDASVPDSSASQATPDAPSSTPVPAAPTAEPFLKIDDRTIYADRDAATKGWTNLKSERDRLAKFEETAKQYGVNDPAVIAQLFEELLQHRERSAQATPATGARTDAATVQAAQSGDRAAYDSLSPEWKAHVDYLNQLGYVTKDALKPIQDQLQSLSSEQQRAEDARVEGAKQNGVTILTGMLKEANLPSDETTVTRLTNQIGNEIYSQSRDQNGRIIPGSPEHRFIFGTEAERAAIVKEHLGFYTGLGEAFHTAKNASYASSKTAAQSQAPRSLPAQNAPATPARQGRISPEDSMARVRAILESAPD
jgi:hypothetical protein